ncbi:MAG: HepT-like ribonuclease domain-containing protein [Armatimonadota bacterium]
MLPEEDRIRIRHVIEAADDALRYVRDRKREDLDSDRQLTHALVACLLIMGEAANAISTETVLEHPEIEWRDIIGMRHRLIHAYYNINLTVVWKTLQEDLPGLRGQLETLLRL